ncbi:MAG: dipeptidase [Flavobacteriales bacterium]|nr:dipeptidase [Flavobacteriales bacterium]
MKDLHQYIEDNKDRMLSELFDLLRIPSISALSAHKEDMYKTANAIKVKLETIGVDHCEVMETGGHPAVFAKKTIDTTLPTVLVYGHYDVQPVDPLELWESDPFEPFIKATKNHPEGAIIGRGANDDKGQMYMHILAFEYLVKSGNLPCNVKFLIEGEEEIGSANLDNFIEKNKDILSCDVVLVSDTTMAGKETPSVMTGLRGLSYFEIKLSGPNRDLHSGHFGGAVINPCMAMCEMLSSLHDVNGKINIPHFYDGVIEVSPQERAEMAKVPFDPIRYNENVGVDYVNGEKGYSTRERCTIRPALDINGIWGGYIGEGAKTILPACAHAKVSIRLVPGQDPHRVNEMFINHIKQIAPKGTKVEISATQGAFPYVTPITDSAYVAASKALEMVYGKPAVPVRGGGSIGVVPMFEKFLGKKTILLGFGLDTDAIHSPNENYSLGQFFRGVEVIPYFYKFYAELKK